MSPRIKEVGVVRLTETVFDGFAPKLDLSFASAVYGLVGLFLGSLMGELIVGRPPASASLRPLRASSMAARRPGERVQNPGGRLGTASPFRRH
jgi:hypothetical protein